MSKYELTYLCHFWCAQFFKIIATFQDWATWFEPLHSAWAFGSSSNSTRYSELTILPQVANYLNILHFWGRCSCNKNTQNWPQVRRKSLASPNFAVMIYKNVSYPLMH